MLSPKVRPSELPGIIYKTVTDHGNVYVTVTWHEEQMFEVFVQIGKAGGCASAQSEGLGRMISLNLRSNVDPKEIIDQLQGLQCSPIWHDGEQVLSIADAVSKIMRKDLDKHASNSG